MLIRGFSLRLFSEALSVAFPMGLAPYRDHESCDDEVERRCGTYEGRRGYTHSLVILRACPFTLSIAHDSR